MQEVCTENLHFNIRVSKVKIGLDYLFLHLEVSNECFGELSFTLLSCKKLCNKRTKTYKRLLFFMSNLTFTQKKDKL